MQKVDSVYKKDDSFAAKSLERSTEEEKKFLARDSVQSYRDKDHKKIVRIYGLIKDPEFPYLNATI